MCLFRRQLDAKSRRIFAAGNLCLSSGLLLTLVGESHRHRHPAVFDGLRGLLIGLAITLLFWSVRHAGGCATRS